MMRKILGSIGVFGLAVAAMFALVQPAGAQYSPDSCTVMVTPTSVAPGGTITLSGSATSANGPVAAGSPISFSINGVEFATTTTDAAGNFAVEATIPADLGPGTYTIVADCGLGLEVGNTNITVTSPGGGTNPPADQNPGGVGANNAGNGSNGSSGGGSLARTGTDLGFALQIAIALLALGGVTLALTQSRRRSAA